CSASSRFASASRTGSRRPSRRSAPASASRASASASSRRGPSESCAPSRPTWSFTCGPEGSLGLVASGWFVDLHSHVVPSGDDGAQSMDEGAELCLAAARHGTRTLFATPHVAAHVPPDEAREALVAERAEELRERTGIDLRLGWE